MTHICDIADDLTVKASEVELINAPRSISSLHTTLLSPPCPYLLLHYYSTINTCDCTLPDLLDKQDFYDQSRHPSRKMTQNYNTNSAMLVPAAHPTYASQPPAMHFHFYTGTPQDTINATMAAANATFTGGPRVAESAGNAIPSEPSGQTQGQALLRNDHGDNDVRDDHNVNSEQRAPQVQELVQDEAGDLATASAASHHTHRASHAHRQWRDWDSNTHLHSYTEGPARMVVIQSDDQSTPALVLSAELGAKLKEAIHHHQVYERYKNETAATELKAIDQREEQAMTVLHDIDNEIRALATRRRPLTENERSEISSKIRQLEKTSRETEAEVEPIKAQRRGILSNLYAQEEACSKKWRPVHDDLSRIWSAAGFLEDTPMNNVTTNSNASQHPSPRRSNLSAVSKLPQQPRSDREPRIDAGQAPEQRREEPTKAIERATALNELDEAAADLLAARDDCHDLAHSYRSECDRHIQADMNARRRRKDTTDEICDDYAQMFPEIVKKHGAIITARKEEYKKVQQRAREAGVSRFLLKARANACDLDSVTSSMYEAEVTEERAHANVERVQQWLLADSEADRGSSLPPEVTSPASGFDGLAHVPEIVNPSDSGTHRGCSWFPRTRSRGSVDVAVVDGPGGEETHNRDANGQASPVTASQDVARGNGNTHAEALEQNLGFSTTSKNVCELADGSRAKLEASRNRARATARLNSRNNEGAPAGRAHETEAGPLRGAHPDQAYGAVAISRNEAFPDRAHLDIAGASSDISPLSRAPHANEISHHSGVPTHEEGRIHPPQHHITISTCPPQNEDRNIGHQMDSNKCRCRACSDTVSTRALFGNAARNFHAQVPRSTNTNRRKRGRGNIDSDNDSEENARSSPRRRLNSRRRLMSPVAGPSSAGPSREEGTALAASAGERSGKPTVRSNPRHGSRRDSPPRDLSRRIHFTTNSIDSDNWLEPCASSSFGRSTPRTESE